MEEIMTNEEINFFSLFFSVVSVTHIAVKSKKTDECWLERI
jgi:hypothetical protein